jgi:hypothetical protein
MGRSSSKPQQSPPQQPPLQQQSPPTQQKQPSASTENADEASRPINSTTSNNKPTTQTTAPTVQVQVNVPPVNKIETDLYLIHSVDKNNVQPMGEIILQTIKSFDKSINVKAQDDFLSYPAEKIKQNESKNPRRIIYYKEWKTDREFEYGEIDFLKSLADAEICLVGFYNGEFTVKAPMPPRDTPAIKKTCFVKFKKDSQLKVTEPEKKKLTETLLALFP